MKSYIALFRGINVGGSHLLPMKDLKLLFEQNGCLDVRTYIQSGNVTFRSSMSDVSRLANLITDAVSRRHGFAPHVVVLTRAQLHKAAAGNPYPEATEDPKSVHLFFLAERPRKPDLKACEAIKRKTERFQLKGSIFYLHAPDGFGISKLAARAEKLLGVSATARNWRTVMTLLEMAKIAPGT
jgi:uncharacterized protein (DUF1697 family)